MRKMVCVEAVGGRLVFFKMNNSRISKICLGNESRYYDILGIKEFASNLDIMFMKNDRIFHCFLDRHGVNRLKESIASCGGKFVY